MPKNEENCFIHELILPCPNCMVVSEINTSKIDPDVICDILFVKNVKIKSLDRSHDRTLVWAPAERRGDQSRVHTRKHKSHLNTC